VHDRDGERYIWNAALRLPAQPGRAQASFSI